MFSLIKKNKKKISVITWDANFRESHHTIDYFARQAFSDIEYELIWVDFYDSNDLIKNKISQYRNFKLHILGNTNSAKWHLGVCINEGVKMSSGEVIVIPDGDIAVDDDFLTYIWNEHRERDDLVVYFRRYDEPKENSCEKSRRDISYLKESSRLTSRLNYGGCLSLKRINFEKINGYETHSVFAGPGMNGMETYVRLRNLGLSIKWAKDKRIYHPWHADTLGSGFSDSKRKEIQVLKLAKIDFPWINPGHLEQSWVSFCREAHLSWRANKDECERFLSQLPFIDLNLYEEIDSYRNSKLCQGYKRKN